MIGHRDVADEWIVGDEVLHRLPGTHEEALRGLDTSEVRRHRLLLFWVVDSCYHKKTVLDLLIVMLSFLLVDVIAGKHWSYVGILYKAEVYLNSL